MAISKRKLLVDGQGRRLLNGVEAEKVVDTVPLSMFTALGDALRKSDLNESAHYIPDALEVVRALNIKPGDKAFVLSPSISLWAERMMLAQGARVDMVEGSSLRFEMKKSWLEDEFKDFNVDGLDKLRRLIKNRARISQGNFLYLPLDPDSYDIVLMSCVLDSDSGMEPVLLKGLDILKTGGRLSLGFYTPSPLTFDNEKVLDVSGQNGIKLEEIPTSRFFGDEVVSGGLFRLRGKPNT